MVGVFTGTIVLPVPMCVAFVIGLVVGWTWKPKWATMGRDKLSCFVSKAFNLSSSSSPSWTTDNGEDKIQSNVSPAEYEKCRYLGFIGFSLSLSLSLSWVLVIIYLLF
jgi:hypothetical protein